MKKGQTNNPNGRPKGVKNKVETHLIKTYSQAWLIKLGQDGFNRWADGHKTEAMKIVAGWVPRQVGLDTDTVASLAALAQSMANGK